jgi:DNA replication protein DnaC
MLTEQTIEKMNAMKLHAMVEAFNEQLTSSAFDELAFAERLGLLVDTEYTARENRKLSRRLRAAKMRYADCVEDVDFRTPRRLNRQQFLSLATCTWLTERHNLILTGPTGVGKSHLACALTERACRRGFTAFYLRAPRLLDELAISRVDGSYPRLLARLAKFDLLAIDDWLLAPLKDAERRSLMEVIEERSERGSTLVASQLPIKDWHASIGDPNHADALCDRLLHNAHRIELKGASMRKTKAPPNAVSEESEDNG